MLLYRHNEHVDRPVGGRRGALLTISRGNASSSSSSSTHSLDSASFTSEQQSTNLFAKLEICVKRKCRFRAGRSVVVSARPLEVLAPFLLSLFFDFSTNLKTTPPSLLFSSCLLSRAHDSSTYLLFTSSAISLWTVCCSHHHDRISKDEG